MGRAPVYGDVGGAGDGHDAGHDGNGDAGRCRPVAEAQEDIVVEEELGDEISLKNKEIFDQIFFLYCIDPQAKTLAQIIEILLTGSPCKSLNTI